MIKQPEITITHNVLQWDNFPSYTENLILNHLDDHPTQSDCIGLILKTDGTAGQMIDGTIADLLSAARVLAGIIEAVSGEGGNDAR